MAYKRDNNELLYFLLKQLVNDQISYNRNRYGGEEQDVIEIPEDEFAEKVCKTFYSFSVLIVLFFRHVRSIFTTCHHFMKANFSKTTSLYTTISEKLLYKPFLSHEAFYLTSNYGNLTKIKLMHTEACPYRQTYLSDIAVAI